jgi:hypothetical protein
MPEKGAPPVRLIGRLVKRVVLRKDDPLRLRLGFVENRLINRPGGSD